MRITAALMLKAPRPGAVKTRLAAEVGEARAGAIYRALAERQVREIPADWGCAVHFAPADAGAEMRGWLLPVAAREVRFVPQCDGDLGERMLHAVREGLDRGADAVVLLGGDCPGLVRAELQGVAGHLGGADAVIAPALDGGYVLLALKEARRELFEGIMWSTPSVFEATLERVKRCGWEVRITRAFGDVDHARDLPGLGAQAGWLKDL